MTFAHPGETPSRRLVLASGSRYRAELLQRLNLAFDAVPSKVTEEDIALESPAARAQRLAQEKAREVASRLPGAWVLGSDQVGEAAGQLLHKPGSRQANIEQLQRLSGRAARFHTAVCLLRSDQPPLQMTDVTEVMFRRLSLEEITRYVDREPAYDCAGGFKVEGLGISLLQAVESRDPTALIGLPLIGVSALLRTAGLLQV